MYKTVSQMRVPYSKMNLFYTAENNHSCELAQENPAGSIQFLNGQLLVNEKPVPYYQEGNTYVWETEEEKGSVWLYHFGLAAAGYIQKNGEAKSFQTKADDAVYDLSYSKNGKQHSFSLHMGTRLNRETSGFVLYAAVFYKGQMIIENFKSSDGIYMDAGAFDNGMFRTSFLSGTLSAKLELGNCIWAALGEELVHTYTDSDFNIWSAEITFCPDLISLKGKVTEQTTKGAVTKAGTVYTMTGNANPKISETNLPIPELSEPQKESLMYFLQENHTAPKSVTELFTLPAPDMKSANTLASQTLYYLMVYYAASQSFTIHGTNIAWNQWFGMNKEKAREMVVNVNARILDLVDGPGANEDVKQFLITYAKGALANSYSGSTDEEITSALNPAKSRLQSYCSLPDVCSYFLQGDGKTSIVHDNGYSIAMQIINKYAYAKLTPGLLKYTEDTTHDWAYDLYKQCLAALPQLQIIALGGGSTDISHKTMMLNILDDRKHDDLIKGTDGKWLSMTYASVIYAKVFNMQMAQIADSLGIAFTGDPGHPDFMKMMREIYGIFWEELQKETSDYFSSEILKAFQEQKKHFTDLTKELFIQETLDMTIRGMEMLKAGSTLAALIPKIGSLSQKPWAAYTGTACSIIFYAISIGSLATVFMDWEKATAAEKTEAILQCVQGVAGIAVSAIKIANIKTLLNPEASISDKMNAAVRLKMDGEDMSTIKGLSRAGGTEIDQDMIDYSKKFGLEINDGNEAVRVSKFTKFFRVLEFFVRALNIVLMGFATVMSAIELAKAVKEGGYNASIYLEIISTCFMAISCIIEGVVLVADIIGASCSCIPVVGAVCALVGLVLQIVAMAISKPVNPLAEYIRSIIVPFLNGLTLPSEQWIKDHNKESRQTRLMEAAYSY